MLNPRMRCLWPLKSSLTLAITPGVSILCRKKVGISFHKIVQRIKDVQLGLEIFHDVQKLIIHPWLLRELKFNLVQEFECIFELDLSCRLG